MTDLLVLYRENVDHCKRSAAHCGNIVHINENGAETRPVGIGFHKHAPDAVRGEQQPVVSVFYQRRILTEGGNYILRVHFKRMDDLPYGMLSGNARIFLNHLCYKFSGTLFLHHSNQLKYV